MIRQCKFRDEENFILGGILCEFDNGDRYIICGECGSIFDPDEVEILEIYDRWVDISYTILDD